MAVYTHIDKDTLTAHLARYAIGALESYQGITQGIENTNYVLRTEQDRFILTLFEKRVAEDELPFYLDFMEYMARSGVPAPAVMRARDGQSLLPLAGRPSVITQFLEGASVTAITPEHTAQVGALLAAMHKAGQNFSHKRANSMGLGAWKALVHACFDRADTVENGLYNFLDSELEQLHRSWPRLLPKGAIHADLFPDNVFFDEEGRLCGVIDFYFACWDLLAYDLMLTYNAWCFMPDGRPDMARSRAFFDAYHAVRPLSRAEVKALPCLGRAAAMRIIATRLYDYLNPVEGAQVLLKDPHEYLRILRFHQHARSVADYGLNR